MRTMTWVTWMLAAGLTAATTTVCAAGDIVAAYHCQVLRRLTLIHERGPIETSRDRFLVLALRRSPQSYVQCIFIERDTAMMCEASSGAYSQVGSDGSVFALSERSVAVLTALGFVRPSRDGNFETIVRLGSPPRLAPVATLMLTALRDAYGADAADIIEMDAPKADDSDEPDAACAPGEASLRRSREASAPNSRAALSQVSRSSVPALHARDRIYSAAST